ncbi:MAG: FadR/GntR family transcriptional regulator [Pseudomonadota bacterium]
MADTTGLFGTERQKGLHEGIYRSLHHAILSGRYKAGARLPSESDLARTFSVSRPVLRRAMDLLRRDGLIESRRGSGSFVMDATDLAALISAHRADFRNHLRQMLRDLEFRAVLEPMAAFLAAQRNHPDDLDRMSAALEDFEAAHRINAITHHFDYLFHEALAHATGNPRFVQAIRALEYEGDDGRLQVRNAIHFPKNSEGTKVLEEHVRVFELIQFRDAEGARRAMADHIDAARRRQENYLMKGPKVTAGL